MKILKRLKINDAMSPMLSYALVTKDTITVTDTEVVITKKNCYNNIREYEKDGLLEELDEVLVPFSILEKINKIMENPTILSKKEEYKEIELNILNEEVRATKERIYLEIYDNHKKLNVSNIPSVDRFFNPFDKEEIKEFSFHINTHTLKQLAKCMSKDETRYYLNGIGVSKSHLMSTDGHRLAFYKLSKDFPEGKEYIIPSKLINILIKSFNNELFEFILVKNEQSNICHCKVVVKDYVFHSKLIDGTYPDALRVVPNEEELQPINYYDFTKVLGDAIILGHNTMILGDDEITTFENNSSLDTYVIDASLGIGENKIGLNIKYLKDIYSDKCSLFYKDSASPLLIKENDYLRYVLMPMRIGNEDK